MQETDLAQYEGHGDFPAMVARRLRTDPQPERNENYYGYETRRDIR